MGGLYVFLFIIGCMGFMFLAPSASRALTRARKVTRRYSAEYAPYVVRRLAGRTIPFSVRWTREELFCPRPPRVYNHVTAHITFRWADTATVDLAQSDAAEDSRRDEDQRQYAEDTKRAALRQVEEAQRRMAELRAEAGATPQVLTF